MQNTQRLTTQKAIDLKINHGLSYREIAKLDGTSHVNIIQKIKHLLPDENTKVYQDNKADILDHMQVKLLSHITDKKLKNASVSQLVVGAGILYDKAALTRCQPTNINVNVLCDVLEAIRSRDV